MIIAWAIFILLGASAIHPPPCLWHQWSVHKAFSLAWLSLFALVSLLGLACIVVLRSRSIGGTPAPPANRPAWLALLAAPFFIHFFIDFLSSFFMVFGVPLGSSFNQFSHFILIQKPVSFPIDFQTPFLSIVESQNLPDWALAYTKRSKLKTHDFHFWPHFGCILASKMDAKSSQNASKNLIKIWMNFALKKNRKMDPIWGSRGGPTNQLFTPKIRPGTPWAPQEAPERLQKVPWTIFNQMWSRFHDILLVFCIMFLWLSTLVRTKNAYLLRVAKQIFDWRHPECIQNSIKKTDKLYIKNTIGN